MLAVYSYANSLKVAHQDKCGGERGLCQDLAKMSSREFFTGYLKILAMSFGEDERIDSLTSNPEMEARHIGFDPPMVTLTRRTSTSGTCRMSTE